MLWRVNILNEALKSRDLLHSLSLVGLKKSAVLLEHQVEHAVHTFGEGTFELLEVGLVGHGVLAVGGLEHGGEELLLDLEIVELEGFAFLGLHLVDGALGQQLLEGKLLLILSIFDSQTGQEVESTLLWLLLGTIDGHFGQEVQG